ncbi:DNA primase-helicase subunit [Aeromonas phage ZPAH1]|nr:hypothetical protein ASwh1_152 [Aeromonas phage Aswh_1]QQG33963.1 DNA primase-helicase subunit [Aeromonas phage ZPAH1]
MSIKRVMDAVYAARMIDLIRKPFRNWEACKLGLIDDQGNLIKRPDTVREKSAYTSFHSTIRTLKQGLQKYGGQTAANLFAAKAGYNALTERYGQPEQSIEALYEAMVAGDADGDPTNIASGVKSGDIVDKGPASLGVKKRRKIEKTLKS